MLHDYTLRSLIAALLAVALLAACSTAGKDMTITEHLDETGRVVKRETTGPAGWTTMAMSTMGALSEIKPPDCDGEALTEIGEVACYMAQQAFAINLPRIRTAQDAIGDTIRGETGSQNAAIGQATNGVLWLIGGVTIARIVDNVIDGATRPNNFTQNVSEEGSGEMIAATQESAVYRGDDGQLFYRSPHDGSANETNDTLVQSPPDFSGGDGGDGETAGAGGTAAPGTVNNVNAEGELAIDGI